MILVGAEAVVENGGIINKLGTYGMALAASAHKKPVYVAVESYKVYLHPHHYVLLSLAFIVMSILFTHLIPAFQLTCSCTQSIVSCMKAAPQKISLDQIANRQSSGGAYVAYCVTQSRSSRVLAQSMMAPATTAVASDGDGGELLI